MDEHIVFRIMKDLGIDNESNVNPRISQISGDDIDVILDKMDSWYASISQRVSRKHEKVILRLTFGYQ